VQSLKKVSVTISDDETRYFMNGIYFDCKENRLVSTDGRRLSLYNLDMSVFYKCHDNFIMQYNATTKKYIDECQGTLYIQKIGDNILLNNCNYYLLQKEIDGQFPNYKRVIPENTHTDIVNLPSVKFLKECKAYDKVIKDKYCKLIYENGTWYSNDRKLSNKTHDKDYSFAINYNYLIDYIETTGQECIRINTENTSKAVVNSVLPDKGYYHIIMPMQLD
jgi:DNA polymerase-3 subunit beta